MCGSETILRQMAHVPWRACLLIDHRWPADFTPVAGQGHRHFSEESDMARKIDCDVRKNATGAGEDSAC
jgi:hypothetical protein